MGVDVALSRRTLLKGAGLAAVVVGLGACSTGSPSAAAVARPLPIPPLLPPRSLRRTKVFGLHAQTGTTEIVAGARTATAGYNGAILGPTIRLTQGDDVRIELANRLRETTTLHLHGIHVPQHADGGPDQPIEPGRSRTSRFRVRQRAATGWYHPHVHGSTSSQIHRGLAGLVIVDDRAEARLDLPRDYGVDDIPLILQDKQLTEEHTLDDTTDPDVGHLGRTITVNGIADPVFTATTRRVRLRVVDASTARLYNLALTDDRPFTVIASDGGLLDKPKRVTRLPMSPGERTEIVVDLAPGETITLRTAGFQDGLGMDADGPDFGNRDDRDLLTIVGPPATASLPAPLPVELGRDLRDAPAIGLASNRSFDLDWFQINGQLFDPTRVDAEVPVGAYEKWTVRNTDTRVHNFHVHGTPFRVLRFVTETERPQTEGWKDTLLLPPGAVATLAVRFDHYASSSRPYAFGSHLAYNADQGMEGRILVVTPRKKPTRRTRVAKKTS